MKRLVAQHYTLGIALLGLLAVAGDPSDWAGYAIVVMWSGLWLYDLRLRRERLRPRFLPRPWMGPVVLWGGRGQHVQLGSKIDRDRERLRQAVQPLLKVGMRIQSERLVDSDYRSSDHAPKHSEHSYHDPDSFWDRDYWGAVGEGRRGL